VEQNPDEAVHMAQALAAAGFAVDLVTDRSEALAICRQRSFDAIAVDTRLVGPEGWEGLQALRSSVCRQNTPVVLVTPGVAREEVALGIQDILTKSASPAELVASLERAGVPPEGEPIVLVVDDDVEVRSTLEGFLREAGYRPIFSPSGDRALVVAMELGPAAVILDPVAPTVDGFDFLRRLRQTGAGATIPVILWTDLTLRRAAGPDRVV
jgi:DNA-binding response OmpR family regulator